MGDKVYRGRSEDAAAPFLSSEFWQKGVRIAGVIERVFKIDGRNNYNVKLLKAVELDGEPYDTVSLGESAGLRMALQAAHLRSLQEADQIVLECVGETPSKKAGNSPRKDFEIEITRPDVEEYIPEYAR